MKKYFYEKQELDKSLEQIISPTISNKQLNILDACCGIGHISSLLNSISQNSKILGIDQTQYLIDEAKKLNNSPNISFECSDIYDSVKKFPKFFDVAVCWKTISWLPYYDEIIKNLFSMTKKEIFLSSLFYDGDIDFEIKVREYKKESGKDNFNHYYNVYSLPHFQEFVYDLGAKNVQVYDFDIDIDLENQDSDFIRTHTIKTENGKRLQVSGTILMNWKIIKITLD